MFTLPDKIIHTPVLVLIGPTAIGKTALSLEMADTFGCEIVSVDSMQVYRYMNIGTAKPTMEERGGIKHYLIDIVDPDEQYNSARFVTDALLAIEKIASSGKIPLLTGGTGLYLKALTEGLFESDNDIDETIRQSLVERLEKEGREALFQELQTIDPHAADRIHKNDTQRLLRALEIYKSTGRTWSSFLQKEHGPAVQFENILQIGLTCDRQILYNRIETRTRSMIDEGLIEETEKLQHMGYAPELPAMKAIGYKHVNNYLAGTWDLDETIRMLMRDTRRYAKRQMTWFKKNKSIDWFERDKIDDVIQASSMWLSKIQLD